MPIILDGTTGITTPGITNTGTFVFQGPVQVPAGTVGAPSVTTDGDTNTGIYFPAADTIGFAEGGVEALRINSSAQIAVNTAGTAGAPVITKTDDLNTGIFFPAADTIAFAEGGVESMRIDSSGNLGLGVTPSAWSGITAFQGARGSSLSFNTTSDQLFLSSNAYYDGSWKYVASRVAAQYGVMNGAHQWYTAPSGTAGNNITFTQAMTLDASGNLQLGTTTALGRLTTVGSGDQGIYFAHSDNSPGRTVTLRLTNNNSDYKNAGVYIQSIQGSGLDTYSLAFGTTSTSTTATERARITSGGSFQVVATGSNSTFTGGGQISLKESGNSPYISWHQSTGARIGYLQMASGGNCSLWVEANQPLVFATNNTERARITSGGSWLVGTTAVTTSSFFSSVPAGVISASGDISLRLFRPTTQSGNGVAGLSFAGQDGSGNQVDVAVIRAEIGTNSASGALLFQTLPSGGGSGTITERARITSGGNFCIGNASASGRLQLGTSTASDNNSLVFNRGVKPSIGGTQAAILCEWNGIGTTESMTFMADAGYKFLDDTGNTEWARITSGGALLVGTTAFTQSGNRAFAAHWSYTGSGGEGGCEFRNTSTSSSSDPNPCLILQKGSTTTTSSQRFIQFYANTTGQPMGGIVGNGAENVQFATLSDVRQKTNIQSISGSLKKILALNPVSFDWIYNNEHVNAGFVAQDVEQVFPEFVIENFSNSGNEPRKGLTGGMTGGIIPHLVKAIQELKAELDALKGSN